MQTPGNCVPKLEMKILATSLCCILDVANGLLTGKNLIVRKKLADFNQI